MKLYFIRHGETDYNVQRKFYGTDDVSINQTGQKQCELVHTKFKGRAIDKILVSSRIRTHQAAELIFPNRQYEVAHFLDEWGFGEWEGLDADQIQAKFPVEWERWLADPFGYTPPASEPYVKHENRIKSGFRALVDHTLDNGSVALVTHLGTIRVIMHDLFPEKPFWEIQLTQGNYTCIDYTNRHFSVDTWNK